LAFQLPHRVIRVDRDYQPCTQLFRRSQIANVANVEDVEASIRQRDLLTLRSPGLHAPLEFFAAGYFG
jgi:hypothetical protein